MSIAFEVLEVNSGMNATIRVTRKLDTGLTNNNPIIIDTNTSMIFAIAKGVKSIGYHVAPTDK